MAWTTEIPVFVPGATGYAALLNQLGKALEETRQVLDEALETVDAEDAPAADSAPAEPAAKRTRKAAA